jgi:hypothetical protein
MELVEQYSCPPDVEPVHVRRMFLRRDDFFGGLQQFIL